MLFFRTLGLRFSWYDKLGQILRGETRTKYISDPHQIEHLLLFCIKYGEYTTEPDSPSDAVILRINREKAIAGRNVSILPIDDRDWRKIAILPRIKPEWVTVYSEGRSSAHGLPWRSIYELPREAFIGGVPPEIVNLDKFNPSSALCGIKYGKTPYLTSTVNLWKEPIREGRAVPLQSLPADCDFNDTNLTHVLQELLISDGVSEQNAKLIVCEHGFPGFGAHVNSRHKPINPYRNY